MLTPGATAALTAFTAAVWPNPVTTETANADTALHFATFYILQFLALAAIRRVLPATLGLLALGALIEVVQPLTGRDADVWDWVADGLGALAALAPLVLGRWLRRQDP